jgi:hypothetical protein
VGEERRDERNDGGTGGIQQDVHGRPDTARVGRGQVGGHELQKPVGNRYAVLQPGQQSPQGVTDPA